MNEIEIVDYLSTHRFFSGLDKEAVKFLSGCAKQLQIAKGDILFRQGERAGHFYLVRSGRISVQIPAIAGPPLVIQNLGPDQILGWSWLISPYQWNFQAIAEDDSTLLVFDGHAILQRCEQEAAFGYALLKRFAVLMSERLDAARRKLMEQWNPPGFA